MHIFDMNQKVKSGEVEGIIVDVLVNKDNNTIYGVRHGDNKVEYFLSKDLELLE